MTDRRFNVPTGDRVYFVRVRLKLISSIIAIAVVVEAAHVEKMKPRAALDGLDLEGMYRAVATDSVRIRLQRERIPISLEDEVLECRAVSEQEMEELWERYRPTRKR